MRTGLAIFRVVGLLLLLLFGLLAGLICRVLPRSFYSWLQLRWNRAVLKIIGVDRQTTGSLGPAGVFLVCNHVSWVDICVIGSQFPIIFLAKSDIASWPVLGSIVKRSGTLFIEQGKGSSWRDSKHWGCFETEKQGVDLCRRPHFRWQVGQQIPTPIISGRH